MVELTFELLRSSEDIEPQLLDIARLSNTKVLANVSSCFPFAGIPDLNLESIYTFLAANDIGMYSTAPWVAPGYYLGHTIFWKKQRLQEILDQNHEVLRSAFLPKIAEHFAQVVNHRVIDFDLNPGAFRFIVYCFADYQNGWIKDVKEWEIELHGFDYFEQGS